MGATSATLVASQLSAHCPTLFSRAPPQRWLACRPLRAADIHEERTRLATQRLTSLLVPAMTILMGIAVGGIVASLMNAMLSLNNLAS